MPSGATRSRLGCLSLALFAVTLFGLTSLAYLRPQLRANLWQTARMATNGPAKQGSLSAWLLEQKHAFLDDLKDGSNLRQWVLVTGNEAGDLDSLASAVGLAFLSTKAGITPAVRFISLVQTVQDDIRLRPENQRALQDADLPVSSLLWLDEVDLPRALEHNARIALVDHNHATGRFGQAPVVAAVIDHHTDEHLYPDANPRVVTTGIGSCSSLIATRFPDFWRDANLASDSLRRSLARLLGDSILLDTANLKRVPGKAGDTDYAAFGLLAPFLSSPSDAPVAFSSDAQPPDDRFNLLAHLKTDVGHLSPRDLLRRDYKSYTVAPSQRRAGLSSVPLALADVGNAVWPAALAAWAAEQDLDVAMILTSYASPKKGKRRKQIAALLPRGATDADLATAVFEHFPAEAGSTLGLKAWTEVEVGEVQGVPEGAAVRVWKQTDTSPTRKQIAPAVVNVLERVAARREQQSSKM